MSEENISHNFGIQILGGWYFQQDERGCVLIRLYIVVKIAVNYMNLSVHVFFLCAAVSLLEDHYMLHITLPITND